MNVAVLSLTRDRLDYTRHCFASLRENAGVAYDHYVLDQGSSDGTVEWLEADETLDLTLLAENVGICRGLNGLLDHVVNAADYDVLVRFDNDCEVTQPDTLRFICELAVSHMAILAPRVLGLNNPPAPAGWFNAGGHTVQETLILGGIFMAIPAALFSEHGFRYDESHPLAAGDEAIVPWWRGRGGRCGYVTEFTVNHFQTTEGQIATFPEYHARKLQEMAA